MDILPNIKLLAVIILGPGGSDVLYNHQTPDRCGRCAGLNWTKLKKPKACTNGIANRIVFANLEVLAGAQELVVPSLQSSVNLQASLWMLIERSSPADLKRCTQSMDWDQIAMPYLST